MDDGIQNTLAHAVLPVLPRRVSNSRPKITRKPEIDKFHHLTQPESRRSSRQQRLFLHRYLRDDCRSVTDVLNMVSRERPEVFDARLVSATFRNLVRTSSRHRHAIKAVCRHPAFNSLLSLAQSRVSSMEGQQLSVVAWALALFHCHHLQLWTLIEERSMFLMKLGPTGLSTEELGRLLFGLSQCKRTALPVFISAASRMNAVGELENCSDNDFANLVQAIGAQTLFLATEKRIAIQQPFVVFCSRVCSSALPPRIHRLAVARDTAPVGADLTRLMLGLGNMVAAARPETIVELSPGGPLCVELLSCVNAVCKKVNDRRYCGLLAGISSLGWIPGTQLSARLAHRYTRLVAVTKDRRSLCTAAVLYSGMTMAMPTTMLEATETAAWKLGVARSDPKFTRQLVQAFATRGYLPSVTFQRQCSNAHKRFYNSQLLAHGHVLAWQLPVHPEEEEPISTEAPSKRHLPVGLKPPPRRGL